MRLYSTFMVLSQSHVSKSLGMVKTRNLNRYTVSIPYSSLKVSPKTYASSIAEMEHLIDPGERENHLHNLSNSCCLLKRSVYIQRERGRDRTGPTNVDWHGEMSRSAYKDVFSDCVCFFRFHSGNLPSPKGLL